MSYHYDLWEQKVTHLEVSNATFSEADAPAGSEGRFPFLFFCSFRLWLLGGFGKGLFLGASVYQESQRSGDCHTSSVCSAQAQKIPYTRAGKDRWRGTEARPAQGQQICVLWDLACGLQDSTLALAHRSKGEGGTGSLPPRLDSGADFRIG